MQMKQATRLTKIAALVSMTAALAACGGGGGGGSTTPPAGSPAPAPAPAPAPSPAPSPAPAPAPLKSNIQLSVPAADYPTGSAEGVAYSILNSERSRCGFGQLRQVKAIDAATKAHSDWMVINNVFSHEEDGVRFPNGYTAVRADQRAFLKGYNTQSFVDEDFAALGSNPSERTQAGAQAMRTLINAPFHLASLFSAVRDVGIGFSRRGDLGFNDVSRNQSVLTVSPGYVRAEGIAEIGEGELVSYPCEGTTGVMPIFYGETPSPFPGRDFGTNPAGTTIYIRGRELSFMVLQSASVVETSSGTSVALIGPFTGGFGSQFPQIPQSGGFALTDKPLKPNTQYTATFNGELNKVKFTRTFKFTTGPMPAVLGL